MSALASVALCGGQYETATHATPQNSTDLLLGAAPLNLVASLDEEALKSPLALRGAILDWASIYMRGSLQGK